jgi:hypothetical protein
MRILVVHDDDGNIRSIGVPAGQFSGQVRLHAPPGHVVTEVEVAELEDEQDQARLERLKSQFRVERGGTETPHLVKR